MDSELLEAAWDVILEILAEAEEGEDGKVSKDTGSKVRKVLEIVRDMGKPGDKKEKSLGPHKYGCLMAVLPDEIVGKLLRWNRENIPNSYLDLGGREYSPHITVLYGFRDSSIVTVEALRAWARTVRPFVVTLDSVSLFPGNEDGDVLKIDVQSVELHAMHRDLLGRFPCENKYPDYKPHVTLAYVRPRHAGALARNGCPLLPLTFEVRDVEWSGADGTRLRIPLGVPGEMACKSLGDMEDRLAKVCRSFADIDGLGPDYQRLFWHPEKKECYWISFDGDEEQGVREVERRLEEVPGVESVRVMAEGGTPKDPGWVEIRYRKKSLQPDSQRTYTYDEAQADGRGHGKYIGSCGHVIYQCRCPNGKLNKAHRVYHISDRKCDRCEGEGKDMSSMNHLTGGALVGARRKKGVVAPTVAKAMSWLDSSRGGALVRPAPAARKPVPVRRPVVARKTVSTESDKSVRPSPFRKKPKEQEDDGSREEERKKKIGLVADILAATFGVRQKDVSFWLTKASQQPGVPFPCGPNKDKWCELRDVGQGKLHVVRTADPNAREEGGQEKRGAADPEQSGAAPPAAPLEATTPAGPPSPELAAASLQKVKEEGVSNENIVPVIQALMGLDYGQLAEMRERLNAPEAPRKDELVAGIDTAIKVAMGNPPAAMGGHPATLDKPPVDINADTAIGGNARVDAPTMTEGPPAESEEEKKYWSEPSPPLDSSALKTSLSSSPIQKRKAIVGSMNKVQLIRTEDGQRGVFKPSSGEKYTGRDNYGNEWPVRQGLPSTTGTYAKREVAASSIADVLGMGDLVPSTVFREVDGELGSVQAYVSDANVAGDQFNESKSPFDGEEDAARAATFDYLIGHMDRHLGNWLISSGDKLALIDNGLAFPVKYAPTDVAPNVLHMWYNASSKGLKVPESWKTYRDKWGAVESHLRKAGLEPEAIELTRERFDNLVANAGKPIAELQSPWGGGGYTMDHMLADVRNDYDGMYKDMQ